jgi:hypothetical protein
VADPNAQTPERETDAIEPVAVAFEPISACRRALIPRAGWSLRSRATQWARAAIPLAALVLALVPLAGASPPGWLEHAAHKAAATLSDGTKPVSITYVAPRSRFPRVVLTGSFVCNNCPVPPGGSAPRGTVGVTRFDGKTQQSLDFSLCTQRARCEATLCGGQRCTRARELLDAAVIALQERLGAAAPGTELGTHPCHLNFTVGGTRYVIGSCTTTFRRLGARSAIARFTERWRREYRHGRWVDVGRQTHTWRVLVTNDGWKTRITSSGDPTPQLVR